GLYTVSEAARLLRAPTGSIYRWAKGYSFRSKGVARRSAPLLERDYPELIAENILTFIDLVELKVVRDLSSLGVKLATIRRAAECLSDRYQTSHPFAIK